MGERGGMHTGLLVGNCRVYKHCLVYGSDRHSGLILGDFRTSAASYDSHAELGGVRPGARSAKRAVRSQGNRRGMDRESFEDLESLETEFTS